MPPPLGEEVASVIHHTIIGFFSSEPENQRKIRGEEVASVSHHTIIGLFSSEPSKFFSSNYNSLLTVHAIIIHFLLHMKLNSSVTVHAPTGQPSHWFRWLVTWLDRLGPAQTRKQLRSGCAWLSGQLIQFVFG
jgi:hypothetical protein